MHHIVSDGWSMGVLVRELARPLRGLRPGPALALPELPVQYADYAVWQRQLAPGRGARRQLGYWKRAARGRAQPCWSCPPTARARPSQSLPRRRRCPCSFPRELSEALKALASAKAPRSSCCCSPPSRCCCTATPARTTSSSARPSRAARRPRPKASSASSSTRWCCAPRLGGRPPSASCWRRCARRRWAPTRTRTCPSRSWWRSSSPSAT